jgi:hypothetical protein
MNMKRGIMKPLGLVLLALCRTVYCWMFLVMSYFMFHTAYTNIQSALQTHVFERRTLLGGASMAVYAIVFDITWWMFVRGKPALKPWAIAANLICALIYLPGALFYWNWRGFLRAELDVWILVLIGILGIIIFSIPYQGWRRKQLDELARTASRAS